MKMDDVEPALGQQAPESSSLEPWGSRLLRDERRHPPGAATEAVMHDRGVVVVWTIGWHSLRTQHLERVDAVRDFDVVTSLGERIDEPPHGDAVPPRS
jgi:hypothetical protein